MMTLLGYIIAFIVLLVTAWLVLSVVGIILPFLGLMFIGWLFIRWASAPRSPK